MFKYCSWHSCWMTKPDAKIYYCVPAGSLSYAHFHHPAANIIKHIPLCACLICRQLSFSNDFGKGTIPVMRELDGTTLADVTPANLVICQSSPAWSARPIRPSVSALALSPQPQGAERQKLETHFSSARLFVAWKVGGLFLRYHSP